MDNLSLLCIVFGMGFVLYTMLKRYQTQKLGASRIQEEIQILEKKEEESGKKQRILKNIEAFLKNAKFEEVIGRWREDRIYRYIYKDGSLYEFDDIMTENNQRVGLDEDNLCFKRLCYKRVSNPVDFLTKYPLAVAT